MTPNEYCPARRGVVNLDDYQKWFDPFSMNIPLEIKVIKRFFKKGKQERYIGFVSSVKNRKKFILELPHLKDLNWENFTEAPSIDIINTVVKGKADSCYVISESSAVDGSCLPIDQAIALTDNGFAMIVVFGDANQIYYEGEPPHNRYLSKKSMPVHEI